MSDNAPSAREQMDEVLAMLRERPELKGLEAEWDETLGMPGGWLSLPSEWMGGYHLACGGKVGELVMDAGAVLPEGAGMVPVAELQGADRYVVVYVLGPGGELVVDSLPI